jgi:DNA-binding CsgD family transcriptional regulator
MTQHPFHNSDSLPLSRERLSALIGLIYDCALNPALWPVAGSAIGEATHCCAVVIQIQDLETSTFRVAHTWNYEPIWLARMNKPEYAAEFLPIQEKFLYSHGVGNPATLSRDAPEFYESRYAKEWAKPQGFVDVLCLNVIHHNRRLGLLTLTRHESCGLVTDEDIAVLQLLAPHICRAIQISDLLDMKMLEQQALASTLNSVTVGVVIVATAGRILHANEMAQHMFKASTPIQSTDGHLLAADAEFSGALLHAIALAQVDETSAAASSGVPLSAHGHSAAVAHVLPLARGSRRARLMPQAAAAVFITHETIALPTEFGAIARMFNLTQAETRQLEQLMAGATLSEAAEALHVSEATARTHRERIFAKMGVRRQRDLVALIRRLVPPIVPLGRAG